MPSAVARRDGPAKLGRNPDKAHREQAARPSVDRQRIVEMLDAAGVHDRDLVGHGQRFVLIVGDEDGRRIEGLQESPQFDLHRLAQIAVERA